MTILGKYFTEESLYRQKYSALVLLVMGLYLSAIWRFYRFYCVYG